MNIRPWIAAAALTLCVLLFAWLAGGTRAVADEPKTNAEKDGNKDLASALFGLAKVHDIHLRLSAKEWAKLQPAAPLSLDARTGSEAEGEGEGRYP